MAHLHVQRPHRLDWAAARRLTEAWAAEAEARWGLRWTATPQDGHDRLDFRGPGVQGVLQVWPEHLVLEAELGFLWRAYQGRIEAEIQRQLDLRLGPVDGAV
ncbi:polyhydroxyalkanoic acid system family protein [Aquabacterium sp. A08]|uniref:polyhydroxyalkanoic acid system family protein n=1 Tax=Aquabacterium sp. A08 TaxID=2718532 RepID=UPI00141E86EC|nr:polyhydroxyalkanoic acid synthase [Aquabacterium sp. A08]